MLDDLLTNFYLEGGRYHCSFCSYDTQLKNKAMAHVQKKHDAELKKASKKPARSTQKKKLDGGK